MYILDDNERICAKCGNVFDDSFQYRFCPECGKELKNVYEYLHEENAEFETSAGICLSCLEKFFNDNDFCPNCGNKLLKGKINLKERTFETKWNNTKAKYSLEALSGRLERYTDPYQEAGVRDVLMQKSYFDKKLKEDCILFNQPQRQRLSFNQVRQSIDAISAYSVHHHKSLEYHFITVKNIDEKELWELFYNKEDHHFGSNRIVTKIGKNLYLIFDTADNIKSKLKLV